jgi:hypothetical protein
MWKRLIKWLKGLNISRVCFWGLPYWYLWPISLFPMITIVAHPGQAALSHALRKIQIPKTHQVFQIIVLRLTTLHTIKHLHQMVLSIIHPFRFLTLLNCLN